jgi:chemotaxis protein MotB
VSRKHPAAKVSHERWLVSYADFITLLFAFFVVLFAFAKADEKRQAQVSSAINTAFQTLSIAPTAHRIAEYTWDSLSPAPEQKIVAEQSVTNTNVQVDLEHIRRDLQQRLALQISNRTVFVQLGREGLVISLREAGFFDSGSAIPKPETTPTLRQIAEALRGAPYDVRIEGHTDNFPIHDSDFDSNWELSSARSVRIARMFLELKTVPPGQIYAAGFGEFRPLGDNNTPEGRAQNRRVDIVVMPRVILNRAEPDQTKDRNGWRRITDQ